LLGAFLTEIRDAGFVDYANRLKLLMIRVWVLQTYCMTPAQILTCFRLQRYEQKLVTQPFRAWETKNKATVTTPKTPKKNKEHTKIPENGTTTNLAALFMC